MNEHVCIGGIVTYFTASTDGTNSYYSCCIITKEHPLFSGDLMTIRSELGIWEITSSMDPTDVHPDFKDVKKKYKNDNYWLLATGSIGNQELAYERAGELAADLFIIYLNKIRKSNEKISR